MNRKSEYKTALVIALTATIMACGAKVRADDQALLDKIAQLEKRVAEMEGKGPAAEAAKASPWVLASGYKLLIFR